jgi:predicted MFS family arabinose efflux permease
MQTTSEFTSPLSGLNVRFAALPTLFFLLGLLNGAWVSRIPAICDNLQISYAALAAVLLSGGMGGLISHWFASRLMSAFGSSKAALHTGLGMGVSLLAIGLASTVPLLMIAVLMLGLASGSFGVAINNIGAAHEKKAGKSRMAGLYALCCAGSLTGVFSGGLIAGSGLAPSFHFLGISLISAIVCCCSCMVLEPDYAKNQHHPATAKKMVLLPRGALLPLGILGFCGAMAQNSIAEWSGVFLKQHFGVSDSIAPMALSAFSVMMLIFRLMGDRLKERYGAGRLISLGGIIAALGLFSAVFAPHAYVALAGFSFAGIGLSLLFPFIYSAAGKQGASGITSIAGMCNLGILAGPLVMGAMADILGIQGTIGLISLLSAMIAMVAARSSLLK